MEIDAIMQLIWISRQSLPMPTYEGHHSGFYYKIIDNSICVYAARDSGPMLAAFRADEDLNLLSALEIDQVAREKIDANYNHLLAQADNQS